MTERVTYQTRPAVRLPSLIQRSSKRRRSSAKPMPRAYRVPVVIASGSFILVAGVLAWPMTGAWTFAVAAICMAAFVVVVVLLEENRVQLANLRARACEREMHAAKRELTIVNGHFAAAHNAIKRVNPAAADELLSGVTADLMRAHITNRRLDADA